MNYVNVHPVCFNAQIISLNLACSGSLLSPPEICRWNFNTFVFSLFSYSNFQREIISFACFYWSNVLHCFVKSKGSIYYPNKAKKTAWLVFYCAVVSKQMNNVNEMMYEWVYTMMAHPKKLLGIWQYRLDHLSPLVLHLIHATCNIFNIVKNPLTIVILGSPETVNVSIF